MYWLRSSNSLLLTIRLFTLATISSTMAPRAGADRTTSDATAARRAREAGCLIAVFARVIEGENGAVDMDFRVLLEIGDVAVKRLLPFLAEQFDLDAALDVADVRVLRLHL